MTLYGMEHLYKMFVLHLLNLMRLASHLVSSLKSRGQFSSYRAKLKPWDTAGIFWNGYIVILFLFCSKFAGSVKIYFVVETSPSVNHLSRLAA